MGGIDITDPIARLGVEYQTLDLRGIWHFVHRSCGGFGSYIVGRWVYLEENFSARAGNGVDTNRVLNTEFTAGGIGLGFDSYYQLFGCLNLKGHLGVLALVGDSKLKRFEGADDGNAFSQTPYSRATYAPMVEARLALEANWCFCGYAVQAELGFDYQYFYIVRSLPLVGAGLLFAPHAVGFVGPSIRLSVGF